MTVDSPLTMGDFVLVEFRGKQRTRCYVGQAMMVDDEEVEVQFFKRDGLQMFVIHENDKNWIDKNQILHKLPVPTIDNRGRHKFPQDIVA